VDVIRVLVPSTCQIHVGSLKDVSLPRLRPGSVCLLGDGNFTVEIGNWLNTWGMERAFYTRQLRRSVKGWNNTSIALRHAYLGGVAHGHVRLGSATRKAASKVTSLPNIAPRDASTVLSVKGVAH
jgi:hypothetical protein